MALILLIDTATEQGGLWLSKDGVVLASDVETNQRDHASWIHTAIKRMFDETGFELSALDAIAVSEGPGSYTGLRVGMSTAKGLAYALNKPLIGVGTLLLLAASMQVELMQMGRRVDYIVPMIDARRMEVFTAVYDFSLNEESKPEALILSGGSYEKYLQNNDIVFCGNGSAKFRSLCTKDGVLFSATTVIGSAFAKIAFNLFLMQKFTDLPYSEPVYIKEFYTHQS